MSYNSSGEQNVSMAYQGNLENNKYLEQQNSFNMFQDPSLINYNFQQALQYQNTLNQNTIDFSANQNPDFLYRSSYNGAQQYQSNPQMTIRSTMGGIPQKITSTNTNSNSIKLLQLQNEELNQQLENLKQELQEKLSKQKQSYKVEIDGLKNQILDLEQEMEDKNREIKIQKTEIQTLKQNTDKIKSEKIKIQEEKEELEEEYNYFSQKISSQNRQTLVVNYNQDDATEQHKKQIQKLREEFKKQKQELTMEKQLLQENLDSLQTELEKQIKQVDQEHQHFMEARDEITKLQKTITQKNEQIRQLHQQQMIQMDAQKSSNIEQQRMKDQIRQQEFEINCLQEEIRILKEITNQLKGLALDSSTSQVKFNLNDKLKELEQLSNQLNQKQQQENLRLKKDIEENEQNRLRQLEILKQKQEDARNNYIKKKQSLVAQGDKIMQEAKKQQGQLDVCFIVDVTGSMERFKEQTRKSVKGSLQIIKQATNRETNWAAVCYKDKAELKQQGKYDEFPFSKDSKSLEEWLETVKCTWGEDTAEDIRGGIKQACKLNWPSRFKIAILICDAPCHGRKYNAGCGDNYPDEDIIDAIEELIEKNIILIALNFTAYTTKMYDEIKKIYESKKKQDLFLYQDLQKMDQAQMANLMAKYIGEASKNATQTNKNQTKSKQGAIQQEIIREKEGAMEALCKQGNFYDFEKQPNVTTVPTKFTVLRVEIKQEAFDKNIENIEFIQCPQDFISIQEGQWNCIRTEKPFAFGMMKDVFLMKKLDGNSEELYVIKTPIGSKPYETLNDALKECKSHLICQKLMKKFVNELQEQKVQKQQNIRIPSVIYSDFLILQESQNSFWIAERFFKGEFVKYNNNYGFIHEDPSLELNKFAQSFTYYTYLISHFNYMVTDVQGVGNYFTDPAINTIKGNLDDTDMGLEGQQMYMVNYEIKKTILTYDYLGLLDIYQ